MKKLLVYGTLVDLGRMDITFSNVEDAATDVCLIDIAVKDIGENYG